LSTDIRAMSNSTLPSKAYLPYIQFISQHPPTNVNSPSGTLSPSNRMQVSHGKDITSPPKETTASKTQHEIDIDDVVRTVVDDALTGVKK
jgi:hypothetical protein